MAKSLKQYEVLQRASLFLERHHREQAVAPLLLQHYLQVSRASFYMRMREVVPESVVRDFEEAIKHHAETGVPVAHLTGKAPFYGREFMVNRDVLIPRPETEELVDGVLTYVHERDLEKSPVIMDVGTGSGVIAITLKLEFSHATVYATDISEKALAVARDNASELGAEVTFLEGDLLRTVDEEALEADIIVSNPPYIAEEESLSLQDTVRDFDPGIALFAKEHGLEIYQRLFRQLKNTAPKLVALEIGHIQGGEVKQMAEEAFPESTVVVRKDINGRDRMVFVEREAGE